LRHYGARINDRCRHDDLRIIILENELLRVTVRVDLGADITELLFKPRDVDFLWHRPGVLPGSPRRIPTSCTNRPFLDYYEGGWQELFPHASEASQYAGAELGFHGETWGLPWEYRILDDDPDLVSVRLSVRTLRMPFLLERVMSLRAGEPILRMHETVTNEGKRTLDFMWGHHPAVGQPFLDEQCVLDAPARKIRLGETLQPWPVDSSGRNHSRLVRESSDTEVMKYLHDLEEGWVAVTNPRMGVGVGFVFDTQVFDCVWLWHEFGYTQEYPWFGRAYVLGVEPFSSLPGARESGGRLLSLEGESRLETDFLTVAYEGKGVRHISSHGAVTTR
jgi:hypothetical protein